MTSYCWGDRFIPHRVIHESPSYILLDGFPQGVSPDMVRGKVHSGDRVRILVSGGNWMSGTVLEGDRLRIQYDAGFIREVHNTRTMQLNLFAPLPPELVPLPVLKDFEEDEMNLALQYDLLKPLKIGDRIRVVLAGKPLEHLTGAMATVDGLQTCGLVPVIVDGHGLKLFRREQLDAEPDKKGGTGETLQLPEDEPQPPSDFYLGQQVTHRGRWLGKLGSSRPLVPI